MKYNKPYNLIFLIFLITYSSLGSEPFVGSPSTCGKYSIRGVARIEKDEILFVVNEKSKSQITLSLPIIEQAKLGPYINRPVTLTASLVKKMDGTKGSIAEIFDSPKGRVPDPLRAGDTGFKLLTAQDCLK